MMGFFSNLFAKQNCAVCGKECGTLHRSKLRDGQFLCDDCGNKCSKYIRLSELTLDEAKEHMEYMARMKRVFDEVFDKTEFRVNAYPSTPTQMGLVFCDELGMLYIDDRTGGRVKNCSLSSGLFFAYLFISAVKPSIRSLKMAI